MIRGYIRIFVTIRVYTFRYEYIVYTGIIHDVKRRVDQPRNKKTVSDAPSTPSGASLTSAHGTNGR
jgi:hypothetical protein